ncbi:MAG: hypothetical protein HQM12_18580 [SAR324 cluster bacterium]|nr:hypothetical protein [SAR324 cluster bacterium]
MSDLKTRIETELENIEKSLNELPQPRSCWRLSRLELSGVAAILHNFYSGVENILKVLFKAQNLHIPEGANWHRDLLNTSIEHALLSSTTAHQLRTYLAFRHFFVHAYVIDLDEERLEDLVQYIDEAFRNLKRDLSKFLKNGE